MEVRLPIVPPVITIFASDNELKSPWIWPSKITDAEYKLTKRNYKEELKKEEEKIKKEQKEYEKEQNTNNKCKNFIQQHKIIGGISFSFSIFLIFIII